MGAGKIIAIIGGILGILSVVLYHIMPDLFNFWRIDGGPMFSITLGGFGFTSGWFMGVQIAPVYAEDIFLLIIAILIVAGGVLALVGGLVENKAVGILGGIVLLAGPILLIVALLLQLGSFADLALLFPPGESLLFGSLPGVNWGIWIGSFLALGGGVLGLVGGATV